MSSNGLARLRVIVLADTDLQKTLLAVPDRRQFVARVVEEARARNCDVRPEEVEEALRTNMRAWNQRWI